MPWLYVACSIASINSGGASARVLPGMRPWYTAAQQSGARTLPRPGSRMCTPSGRKQLISPPLPRTPKGMVRRRSGESRAARSAICRAAPSSTISTGRPLPCSRSRLPVSIRAGKRAVAPSSSISISIFQRVAGCRRPRISIVSARIPRKPAQWPSSMHRPAPTAEQARMHSAACRMRLLPVSPVTAAAHSSITGACSRVAASRPRDSARSVTDESSAWAASRRSGRKRAKLSCTAARMTRSIARSIRPPPFDLSIIGDLRPASKKLLSLK